MSLNEPNHPSTPPPSPHQPFIPSPTPEPPPDTHPLQGNLLSWATQRPTVRGGRPNRRELWPRIRPRHTPTSRRLAAGAAAVAAIAKSRGVVYEGELGGREDGDGEVAVSTAAEAPPAAVHPTIPPARGPASSPPLSRVATPVPSDAGSGSATTVVPGQNGPAAAAAAEPHCPRVTAEHQWCMPCAAGLNPITRTAREANDESFSRMRAVCEAHGEHMGNCRVYYDPVRRVWGAWWSCCHESIVSESDLGAPG